MSHTMPAVPSNNQPIAIIGSSCRFAGGATSPSKLWSLLVNPRDLSSAPPKTRFDLDGFYHENAEQHASTNAKGGYFLEEDPRCFDAGFFNISPKEAEAIDPQQRILLELAYEAMESAGLTIEGLQGSDTSVYVGLMIRDYMDVQARDPDYFSKYMVTGTSSALNANRISYAYDWRGPSLTVDTACSSSLVAVHQAVQGLRAGESRIACVSGTNLLLGPELFISASNMHMVSARSKMWDVTAEGYARGEGFVTFFLKTLENALADGDSIEAVIREIGVNSDGRTKGITLPSPEAQTALIRETYRRAGLDITKEEDRCQYFEAHGTGTQAGDPREAQAVMEAFFDPKNTGSKTGELILGSIKTVVGHTEGTAGMAGMMKALLAMKHFTIPPNLHFDTLNPSVSPFYTNLRIPTKAEAWPQMQPNIPLRTSINSFGFGGTNAHAIMETIVPAQGTRRDLEIEGHTKEKTHQRTQGLISPLLFSAHSETALAATLERYSQLLLEHSASLSLSDLAWTLRKRRSVFPYKAAFTGSTAEELAQKISRAMYDATALTKPDIGIRSTPRSSKPCILGVFTGQGAQWPRMGGELMQGSRLFGESIDKLERVLSSLEDGPEWSLRQQLLLPKGQLRVDEAEISQPLCTAIAIALVDLLRASGVSFSAVVGHSSGEIGAAYAAGVLTAAEAIKVAFYRGKFAKLAGGKDGVAGAMMAVGMGYEAATEFCQGAQFAGRVSVAASNSPTSVTLSGDADAIAEAKELLDAKKMFARMLQVDTAYHSENMSPCAQPYMTSLTDASIQPEDPLDSPCCWISSVYGSIGTPTVKELASTYWRDNMAQTVLFSQALERAVIECGPFDAAIEVGPHPALKGPATQTIQEKSETLIPYTGALNRKESDIIAFGEALKFVWLHLGPDAVDFDGYEAASLSLGNKLQQPRYSLVKDLPLYPWDRSQVFWRESRLSKEFRCRSAPHQLLGRSVPGVNHDGCLTWRNILLLNEVPWLGSHRFQGQALVPMSAFCSLAVDAALQLFFGAPGKRSDLTTAMVVELRDIEVHSAVVVPEGSEGVEIVSSIRIATPKHEENRVDENALLAADLTVLSGPPDGSKPLKSAASARIVIFSLEEQDVLFETHARAVEESFTAVDIDELYEDVGDMGLEYLDGFRALAALRRRWHSSSAFFEGSKAPECSSLALNPFLLESCIQSAYAAFSSPGDGSFWASFLPQRISKVTVNLSALNKFGSWAEMNTIITRSEAVTTTSNAAFHADVEAVDSASGKWLLELDGLVISSLNHALEENDRVMFTEIVWKRDISSGTFDGSDKGSHGDSLDAMVDIAAHRCLNRVVKKWALCPAASQSQFKTLLQYICETQPASLSPGSALAKPHIAHAAASSFSAILDLLPALLRDGSHADTGDALRAFAEQSASTRLGVALQDIIARIAHKFARLNVLEIGSSTIGPSKHLIEALHQNDAVYSFAGVLSSPGNCDLQTHDGVYYMALDDSDLSNIKSSPLLKGTAYDVIIASYSLHGREWAVIQQHLSVLRGAIRPGGYLVLVEPTADAAWSRIFLNCMLASSSSSSSTLTYRDIGAPLSTTELDEYLRRHNFSGIDAQFTSSASKSDSAISALVTQAIDEQIDLLRRPLQQSSLSLLSHQKVAVVGAKALHTSRFVADLKATAQSWDVQVDVFYSFQTLSSARLDDYRGAIVLADADLPWAESRTEQAYVNMCQIAEQLSHVIWVTSNAFAANERDALSIDLIQQLRNTDMFSRHIQFLDVDKIEDCHDLIFAHFMQALIQGLPYPRKVSRLWAKESHVKVWNRREWIPRAMSVQSMNRRLNSQRRAIKTYSSLPTNSILFTPDGTLDKVYWSAGLIDSALGVDLNQLHEATFSLPLAIKVAGSTYLHLFSATQRVDQSHSTLLGFTNGLSSRTIAYAIWKAPHIPLAADKLLAAAASVLTAQHIFDLLPAGNSIVFRPSELIASVLSRISKETDKIIHFIGGNADVPGRRDQSWIAAPSLASKATLSALFPFRIRGFFNVSTQRCLLSSRIVQLLPQGCTTYDQSHIFRLSSTTNSRPRAAKLERILQNIGTSAISMLDSMSANHVTSVMASDLLEDEQRSYSAHSVIDWTGVNTLPTAIKPLKFSDVLKSGSDFVLIDVETNLLQLLLGWLIDGNARKVYTNNKSVSGLMNSYRSFETTIQLINMELSSRQRTDEVISQLPEGANIIYGGLGCISALNEDSPCTQTMEQGISSVQNLTEALQNRAVHGSVVVLSSSRAKWTTYLTTFVNKLRSHHIPSILVSLYGTWDPASRSPYNTQSMNISELDLLYTLTEAFYMCMSQASPTELIAGIKKGHEEKMPLTVVGRPSESLFMHHQVSHRKNSGTVLGKKGEVSKTLQKQLLSCVDLEAVASTVSEFFRARLADLLNIQTDKIHLDSDLTSLGADSLSASDIRNWFLKELDADVSVLKILSGSTIAQLCEEVAAELDISVADEGATSQMNRVDTNLEASAQLPDDGTDEAALVSTGSEDDDTPPTTNAGTFVNGGNVPGGTTLARADTDAAISLKQARRDVPMSFGQIRLWFPTTYLDQQTPFNCTTSFRIHGPIDTARLETAFSMLIDRHESFRTLFYNDAVTGEPMQQIAHSSPFTLKHHFGDSVDDVGTEFRKIADYEYDLSVADTFIATLITHSSVEHTIVFGYHHIIMDGVSWQITLNDLAHLYKHLTAVEMPSIRQYADFTLKQREIVKHRDVAVTNKLAFWKKELAGAPPVLCLFPFSKVSMRKTLTRYNTLDHISNIEPALVAKVKKASLSAKCTSFHFYLSAFVVMLHRFLDADEMVLGVVDANRSDKQFLNTVGFLLDMLPLRLKVNKKERFVHTLRNTRTKAYSALANSGVPLETILEELRVPTSTTNTPLFQVLFNYRMGALRAPKLGEAAMSFLQYEDARAPFDLAVSVDEKDDGSGMLTFSMQDYLYDTEGAELLVSTYVNLLATLATDSSQRLQEVSIANKRLSDKALVAGTGKIAHFGWEQSLTLSQRVEWQASQNPDALAVKDLSGASRTRGETQARANTIAYALKKNGILYGSRVAVYCEATVDSIACILATHKLGGVYVPLDVRNSPERLVAVVTECDPAIVLCHNPTAVSVTSIVREHVRVLNISDIEAAPGHSDSVEGQDSDPVRDVSRLSDPAFILYTSGSTGKPKGIMLSQSACSIHFSSVSSSIGLTEHDVVLQQSALGFDASFAQMFFAVVNGAALVLGDNRGDPADMASIMEAEKVTVTLFIISEMSALLQHGGEALSRCHSWRLALCGGETFNSNLLQKFRHLRLPNLDLYNAYGPTEATIITSLGKVPYHDDLGDDDHKVPCGPPIPNYGVYVLDDQLNPAPLGWPGELCICDPCVSMGYVGQPALTEAKFRPDTIVKPSTASFKGWDRLYRTGDRARQLSDGSFVFLGRVDGDSQVKLRGIRIELSEISSAIIKSSAGAITDAATIAKGETLISFVVIGPGATSQQTSRQPSASFLRDLVQSLPLPLYMRPALAIPLSRLPFTERGKLDMKALSAIDIGQHQGSDVEEDDGHMQLTATEQKLKQVWLGILSYQQFSIPIGKKSDFFSVGGNSLLLIRLRAGIEAAFGVVVPLAQLFQMSSLETLAARLDSSIESLLPDVINWEQESMLDANLLSMSDLRSVEVADVEEGLCVVLTGSTGFLGRELLRQLVANSRITTIHCLAIRPGRSLPDELSSSAKVFSHAGDLADERFGLNEQEARGIFSTAHAVIHNGAQVSHMKSYPSLRRTNVDSTRQLLELAIRSAAHRKNGAEVPNFHFVSTAGVGGLALPAAASFFHQVSVAEFPPATDGSNGYLAAKWASERILERAANTLGITVSIHRPSNITGPGVGDQDIVHSLWRWAEKLRVVPDLAAAGAQGAFDFIGVDTCASNIICSVFEPLEAGKVRYVHQSGDVVVPVGSFQQKLETRLGLQVSLSPFREWIDKAVDAGMDELVATFLRQTNGAFKLPFLIKSDY